MAGEMWQLEEVRKGVTLLYEVNEGLGSSEEIREYRLVYWKRLEKREVSLFEEDRKGLTLFS